MNTHDILNERGKTHGDFTDNSRVQVAILEAMGVFEWPRLYNDVELSALMNIAGKLGRIASGDPHFIDAWRDLAGYSQLVVDRLERTPGATDVKTERFVIE